jgi:hypothetical protein
MALDKIIKVLYKVFGSRNERLVKGHSVAVWGRRALAGRAKQFDDAYSWSSTPAVGERRYDVVAGQRRVSDCPASCRSQAK